MNAPAAQPTRIEWTGNIQVHHPIKWTLAPQVCRHCRTVHQPIKPKDTK